jgi:hypothetical protein
MRHHPARLVVAASLACALVALSEVVGDAAAVRLGASPVAAENARRGTSAWRLREARGRAIAGYSSRVSVAPGGTLELHVSVAPRQRYRVEVYRIGWYGGSGGRLIGCTPSCTTDRSGGTFSVPAPDAASGLLRANWPVTDTIPVATDWVSGYYVADLVLTRARGGRRGAWIPFVVLATPSRRSAILVQAAVNTWQAYNRWGGRSLYWNHTGVGDDHVSFDRPYDQRGAPPYAGRRANLPQAWEFPLVRFLERFGYDVSYTTDVDTDTTPDELLRHRLVMTAGHDEYWTKTMRDAFEEARDHGVNLAFMGANTGYWQMRYADDRRTIVEYRTGDRDPEPSMALKTVRFRDLIPPRPECTLLGVQWLGIGVGDYAPVIGTPLDPWFKGTGFTAQTVLKGLVGYEYDTIVDGCKTPPLTHLFHYSARNNPNADSVRYTAPSGARVFSSGSVWFAAALDPLYGRGDPRLQRFMRNALTDLTRT